MTDPISDERLAEIRRGAESIGSYWGKVAIRELLAEVKRLCEMATNKDQANSEIYAANIDLRAELKQALAERDQAREIARALVHGLGLWAAAVECEVHANLDTLPDWLTDTTNED